MRTEKKARTSIITDLFAPVRHRLPGICKEYGYLGLCFLLPALIMWLIHIGMGVYPFGNNSVLVLDLNGQYIYYFEALRKLIYGEGSILYSFGRSLGGEFLGIVAYYLASPFSFIVALFPKDMMTEALLAMFLLKTGLCGFTFGLYIHKTRQRNPVATVMFSLMYALCAYGVVYQHNTMWIDNMLFLPLILLGIEEMIRRGKFKLFVIALSLAVISNYYIGYMTCIFVAVYFFYAYFSRTPEERNPQGVRFHFTKSFVRIAVNSLIVLAIASVIVLQALYSLTFGKSDFSNPSFVPTQKFDFLDGLTKMYFGSYDTVRPEGLPWLYSGMLAFLLLPLYFLAPHIKVREKIASGLLIVFFFAGFTVSTLDLVWHGFQRPNWLNYRYSFILCFFFVLLAYKAFEKIREIGYRYVLLSALCISALLLVLQTMDYENLPDFLAVWTSLAFVGIYLCTLRGVTWHTLEMRQSASLILAIVVSLEVFCAGYANIVALDEDVVVSPRTGYRAFLTRLEPAVERIQSEDDSFYRMEKTMHRKTNDNLALSMRGLSNSTSTLNADVIQFLNRMGLTSKSHWTKYSGSTPVLDALMGVKYLISDTETNVTPLYEEMFVHNEDLVAYRNPYALSVAFGVSENVADFDLGYEEFGSPFVRMNHLMGRLIGAENEDLPLFKDIPVYSVDYTNIATAAVVGHKKYYPEREGKEAKINYSFYAPNDSTVYAYFPSDYPREVSLYVNGVGIGTFYGNESFSIRELGSFETGELVKVSLVLKQDAVYIANNEPFFYYMDEAVFKESIDILSTSQFVIDEYTEDSFYGHVNAAKDQTLIFTSIPFDEGWVVKVDGKAAETFAVADALMAFRLPSAGEHTVTMEYRPAAVRWGLLLCASGVLAFAGAWILDKKLQRKKEKECEDMPA